ADRPVVDSPPPRPNPPCRRNQSATAPTARSSSRTVQYLSPDGNLTGKARIPDPPDLAELHQQLPATSTAPEETRRRTRHISRLGNVMQQSAAPRRTPDHGLDLPGEPAHGV